MNEPKRALLLGGTGAMGVYLTEELLARGYHVDVVSLDDVTSARPDLRYLRADLTSDEALAPILEKSYDAIVDFLIYRPAAFQSRLPMLLDRCDQLIFLSSYRVYAGQSPVRETSPRLLDVSDDKPYLAEADNEYSLYKAREEDMLRASGRGNWTIIRPSITFSQHKFQLVTLEAQCVVERARQGKVILLPEAAKNVQGTLTWGGDSARMISGLIGSERALGEVYTIATAEHHTWGEIADYYRDLIGLKAEWVDTETYLTCIAGESLGKKFARWQLIYDRLFERVIDNSKILAAAKLEQSQLTPLYDGLKRELSRLSPDYHWEGREINARMDAAAAKIR